MIDTPSDTNYLKFKKKKDDVVIQYHMSTDDKARFVKGIAQTARVLLGGGAKEVLINTSEKYLGKPGLQVIRNDDDVKLLEQNLKLLDSTVFMLSGHIMSTNKMGTSPDNSVVDGHQRVWGYDHLYVADAGIFPTSVGANPMMSIYTTS